MFIKRQQYDELIGRVEVLERYARNDYTRLENFSSSIKALKGTVGDDGDQNVLSRLFEHYYGTGLKQPKMSILKQLEMIRDVLNLEFVYTQESTSLKQKIKKAASKRVTKKKETK